MKLIAATAKAIVPYVFPSMVTTLLEFLTNCSRAFPPWGTELVRIMHVFVAVLNKALKRRNLPKHASAC